jgi:hypothetical protein
MRNGFPEVSAAGLERVMLAANAIALSCGG